MKNKLPPQLLLEAYCAGMFPMGMPDGKIGWYSPDPRGILPLEEFHVPHGLRRSIKRMERVGWELRIDSDFDGVLQGCAAREETWISDAIASSYKTLFKNGYAHSVEIWKDGLLAGGLYGVAIGGAFFGESMFHRVTDASKVALWHLVRILKVGGFTLLDTQWNTSHLAQFGAREIPRDEYLQMLEEALARETSFA
ncbi:MAG: leucyl/phenylalanyl-tRNA--protein transferase [bacterium]|jgi:leucyl/phenylalanyl-tRNA--protein transferase